MKAALRMGWAVTLKHKYIVVVLFLYRLLWGFFLYRFVDSVVTPILARYPGDHPSAAAAHLFMIEAQFRLLKTDLVDNVLWMLGAMFLLRMFLTPLLNAGIYHSFDCVSGTEGTRVIVGIRRAWKSVALLYWLENGLALLPALYLLPLAKSGYLTNPSIAAWIKSMLPYAAAWAFWIFIVHLLFQFMLFSAASQNNVLAGLARACRRMLPLCALSLILLGIGTAASVAVSAASLLWSGFLAIALNQAFQLVRALLTLWTAASQHQLWKPDSAI